MCYYLRSWIVLLHFDLKYLMLSLNVNILSKIIPRNFCSSIGILVESSLSTGLLCILRRLQKCIHSFVFREFELIFNGLVAYLI